MKNDRKEMVLIPIAYNEFEELLNNSIALALEKNNNHNQVTIDENTVLVSRMQVMVKYNITSPTLRDWVKKGILPTPIRKGRRVYFFKREIDMVKR